MKQAYWSANHLLYSARMAELSKYAAQGIGTKHIKQAKINPYVFCELKNFIF